MKQKIFIVQQDTQTFIHVSKNMLFHIYKIINKNIQMVILILFRYILLTIFVAIIMK